MFYQKDNLQHDASLKEGEVKSLSWEYPLWLARES